MAKRCRPTSGMALLTRMIPFFPFRTSRPSQPMIPPTITKAPRSMAMSSSRMSLGWAKPYSRESLKAAPPARIRLGVGPVLFIARLIEKKDVVQQRLEILILRFLKFAKEHHGFLLPGKFRVEHLFDLRSQLCSSTSSHRF